MTDLGLMEAIAAALRAYTTEPLASAEIHVGDQIAFTGANGRVIVGAEQSGAEIAQSIGQDGFMDEFTLTIRAEIDLYDTAANAKSIQDLCKQIRYILRDNRQIVADGETAQKNGTITWKVGVRSDAEKWFRACDVTVTYTKPQEATP